MLKVIIGANIALFTVDRFFDLGLLLPLVVALTIGAFLLLRPPGTRVTGFEVTLLVVVAAAGAVDLLDAGLLPVLRI